MPRGARYLALHGENRQPGVRVFLDLSILESANLLFGKKAGKELLLRAPRFRRGTPVEFAHAPPALLAL